MLDFVPVAPDAGPLRVLGALWAHETYAREPPFQAEISGMLSIIRYQALAYSTHPSDNSSVNHQGKRLRARCGRGRHSFEELATVDTGQKTESLAQLVNDIDKNAVVLPEFQRDFVWEIEKTFDLFDSFVRDIFVGSLIYGVPSFEITVRELDTRPRSGKGSRRKLALTSYSKTEIEKRVKTSGFRLLLDGQQRATSIYRALKGVDDIYLVVTQEDDLKPEIRETLASKRSLEDVLSEFSGEPSIGKINIKISDVFKILNGDAPREKDKAELFLGSSHISHLNPDNVLDSYEFTVYLTQQKNLENLFRQEKLVAYYLLDTDEEKFALFFERSNSKGIQLNFIDILAAKLYGGFNLRENIDKFSDENPSLVLNREVIVRSISYKVSKGKDTGRSYILSNLNHGHFVNYWDDFIICYKRAYEYLMATHLLIHPAWMPYENMLIPMITFIYQIRGKDYSQISELQARLLKVWYWLAIFSRRYSSAAQTYVIEDAQAFEKASKNDYSSAIALLQKINPSIHEADDLFTVNKKYDALYKGVLNFCNFISGGYRNLENGNPVTHSSNLEDHHIFPKDYLKKHNEKIETAIDWQILTDCVVNRTLIPKLTNIKVSNKSPSRYIRELSAKNPNIKLALDSHLIPESIMSGDYDELYQIFLDDRAKLIVDALKTRVLAERDALLHDLKHTQAAL